MGLNLAPGAKATGDLEVLAAEALARGVATVVQTLTLAFLHRSHRADYLRYGLLEISAVSLIKRPFPTRYLDL